jgi:hypothetical protein
VHDPRGAYESRLAARLLTGARLDRVDLALSGVRGLLALVTLVLVWLAFLRHLISPLVLGLPALAFLGALALHDRLATRRRKNRRAVALYERALARLEGRWGGPGSEDGSRFLDPRHPFAGDMDLFGAQSLFQLLCTARTAGGEATLAKWLLEPAAPPVIRARQAAIDELRGRLDLREALWVAGEDVRAAIDPERLTAWGEAPTLLPWPWLRAVLLVLSMGMAAVVTAWAGGWLAARHAGACAALVVAVSLVLRGRAAAVTDAIGRPEAHLALLAALVRVVETEAAGAAAPFAAPLLLDLHERLKVDGLRASRQIARLGRLAGLLSWEKNLVFAPVAYALLWRPQLACAIEAWRRRSGPRIATWLQALSDLEALGSLATLAHDHPERPFAELADASEGPVFDASELAHPLLGACVPNDVRLGGTGSAAGPRLMLLSGSNMSGKSTLMRTVGVNAALAMAGAPVRARRLRVSPLAVGATLRIQDSLLAGTSRFYAEVSRLRQLVDLASGPVPLLFLVDEILAGTNSADRRLGAAAILRGLVDRGALGIASTHDLALTEIVAELPGKAVNQHFEDQLDGDTLRFDYRLRPGVVQRSNALALMRAVGLEV